MSCGIEKQSVFVLLMQSMGRKAKGYVAYHGTVAVNFVRVLKNTNTGWLLNAE